MQLKRRNVLAAIIIAGRSKSLVMLVILLSLSQMLLMSFSYRVTNLVKRLQAMKANKLLLSLSCLIFISPPTYASDDDFLLNFIPSLVASLNCEVDQYETCKYPGGCRRINGNWEAGLCTEKTQSQLNTEFMSGIWYSLTTLNSGNFYNYFNFNKSSLKAFNGSNDFYLTGIAFDTDSFDQTNSNQAIVSYDSINQDWFILDYWGTDIGTISSIEIQQTSSNEFNGCEFYLNYPDLTYTDGICNPIILTRFRLFSVSSSSHSLEERGSSTSNTPSNIKRQSGTKFRPHLKQLINAGESNE